MKAISLMSGGLDSIVATKMILEQGIEVEAVNFLTVFCNCTSGGKTCLASQSASDELGIKLKVFEISSDFYEIVKNPKHGYGRNLNPCLDCRIYMFKKAKAYMEEVGASFIITGEVLGERPMSQRRDAMRIIETESGLSGLLVRPLSAKLFDPSIPEKEGWVDREKFLEISGRCRKPQIALAEELGINDYPCPAGGCLLTDNEFAKKFRDLMKCKPNFDTNDVRLLKTGRVFRFSPEAVFIVGRNEKENNTLSNLARENDICFSTTDVPGPVGIARGTFSEEALQKAASIIARYSDMEEGQDLKVTYQIAPDGKPETISASSANQAELDNLRV